jgi:hypothetical protein
MQAVYLLCRAVTEYRHCKAMHASPALCWTKLTNRITTTSKCRGVDTYKARSNEKLNDQRMGIALESVRKLCQWDDTGQSLMRSAMNQLPFSARAYHCILKLAHTIADLAGSEAIGPSHLAEALQYRPRVLQSPSFIKGYPMWASQIPHRLSQFGGLM